MSRGLLLLVGFVFSRTICIVNISRSVWADKLLSIVSTTIGISGLVSTWFCCWQKFLLHLPECFLNPATVLLFNLVVLMMIRSFHLIVPLFFLFGDRPW